MLRFLVMTIGGLTAVTGAAQMIVPQTMLGLVGASTDAPSQHLFATVGMFMVLFGAAVWVSERHINSKGEILPWATLQKAGASALVALGVMRGVFGNRALIVAAFDGLSALLFAAYWLSRKR